MCYQNDSAESNTRQCNLYKDEYITIVYCLFFISDKLFLVLTEITEDEAWVKDNGTYQIVELIGIRANTL